MVLSPASSSSQCMTALWRLGSKLSPRAGIISTPSPVSTSHRPFMVISTPFLYASSAVGCFRARSRLSYTGRNAATV